jgi:hypothetical protein
MFDNAAVLQPSQQWTFWFKIMILAGLTALRLGFVSADPQTAPRLAPQPIVHQQLPESSPASPAGIDWCNG